MIVAVAAKPVTKTTWVEGTCSLAQGSGMLWLRPDSLSPDT